MAHHKSFVILKDKAIGRLEANRCLILLLLLCFTTSIILCLNELPTGSDIPAHYIKIMNMRSMLREGKFIRWSHDWYCGYAMFDIYPPLIYVLAAAVSLVVNDVALVMKLFTILTFSSFPILLYRLGRALGRSSKGATSMALMFSLTPLNVFFLFNGYFVFTSSMALMFIFLTEFFRYVQNGGKTSLLASTAMLTIISLTYHRALYFILFIILFHFLLKTYRRQVRKAASAALMAVIGVGISSFWLLPAMVDMLALQSDELYQSLISVASYGGVSFHAISMLFIVPYCYLAFKRVRKKGIRNDSELVLLLSLIFFTVLAMGPYGPLHYVVPFSSSQRAEITLLIVTFLAATLASSLFDERIAEGRGIFSGIILSSLVFLTIIIGIFSYPKIASGLGAIDFNYSRGELNDSLTNLINNAYVEQQVFLGRSDEDFLKVLRHISNDNREGRVAFYSNRSQTVDMFHYYALLPLSGKSTPQGIAPEGEGDPKWRSFTQHIIWHANETLLKLSGTRWVISNYPLTLDGNNSYETFGRYRLYELDNAEMINGCEGTIHNGVGEVRIALSQECRGITLAESYHPRWRAFDQDGNEIGVESTEHGFMRITSENNMREVRLVYSDTMTEVWGKVISIVCLILLAVLSLMIKHCPSEGFSRITI